jgi:hypothetical protein
MTLVDKVKAGNPGLNFMRSDIWTVRIIRQISKRMVKCKK